MPHVTRYSVMPIPPVEAHTSWFEAGPLRIGVEYRLLTDAVAAAHQAVAAAGDAPGLTTGLDDRGVALHVCGEQDGEWNRLEAYLEEHSHAQFTHGLCQSCQANLHARTLATRS